MKHVPIKTEHIRRMLGLIPVPPSYYVFSPTTNLKIIRHVWKK